MSGNTTKRRLGETQTWAIAVGRPGGMLRDSDGWKLTVHVRLMHALVNDAFERNGLSQTDVTDAGAELANALVDVQSELHYRHRQDASAWYARERLLSMLEGFLGPRGMADLRLPQRLPWAFGVAMVRNTISYRVIGPSPFGDRYLEWRGPQGTRKSRLQPFRFRRSRSRLAPVGQTWLRAERDSPQRPISCRARSPRETFHRPAGRDPRCMVAGRCDGPGAALTRSRIG
ncbi:hypothetical protein [Gordonia sp. ABSL49_1]|uniref:hypothetical protein n=1 Tax=Gordonia sp. ABSL49_1 TaxID=2920941 RepID=UPI001F1148D0|nr:hypothetical protein [Gordonia sp. ABSL49_1]